MKREILRLKYLSHRDADKVHDAQTEAFEQLSLEYSGLTDEARTTEATRLYRTGVRIGEVLFNYAYAEGPSSLTAMRTEFIPNDAEVCLLDLPSMGSFRLGRKDEYRTGQMAYFLTTDTWTGMEVDDDYIAAVKPEHIQLVNGEGGLEVMAGLRYSVDTLDTLREEAGLPRVRSLQAIK